jgi:phenylacetate-CoA ligase
MNMKVTAQGALSFIAKRLMGPFWIRRHWLNKTQWLDKEELEKVQLRLLQRLIKHCYQRVPYYRKLMNARGIIAEDIRTLDDIKMFPVLTKKDVREAKDEIVSRTYPKWMLRAARTGGSTGTPMVVYRDLLSIGNEHAFVRRQWDWANIGFLERCAYLKGRIITQSNAQEGPLYVYDPIMKELALSTYHLCPDTAKYYASLMKDFGVKAIVGYPSAIYFVAKTCVDCGFKLKMKAVLTTSEALTESMRKVISEAFDCMVYDFYGGAERVCYIQTCEHGRYHIIPEYGLTELISLNNSNGNEFKIVATGFWNMSMPLIRYDTGDVVIKSNESCVCGRAFPVVKAIGGREGDVIRTPSGHELGVTIVVHLLYVICGANNVLETQFVQDAPDHITIEYVPGNNFSEADLMNIKQRSAQYLPRDLRIDVKKVKAVHRTNAGKIKPIVSLISN